MDISNHVSLSALLALEKRLTTVAHNVANASTAGFRAEELRFESLIPNQQTGTAYASTGQTYLSRAAGPIQPTGNSLDIAVKGDYWLAIQTPQGTAYTRDGRLKIEPDGSLKTVSGYPILDVGGGELQVNPGGGPLKIAVDGMITQGGRQLGAVGLFKIPESANLRRSEASGVIPDTPAEPIVTFSDGGILQGHVEGANVNSVMEIMNLIKITRAFESINASINANIDSQKNAIRTIGSNG